MKKVAIDNNNLAHTKWDCKYHIVLEPKYYKNIDKLKNAGCNCYAT